MRIWFDTEFIEDGQTIDLISIGMIREDGALYYAESAEAELYRADDWVRQNVLPHLRGGQSLKSRQEIAADIVRFVGREPEFWAYYADYDWVVLCQLYGRMIDLPEGWPMFCRDVKQLAVDRGGPKLPEQSATAHDALNDAIWTREAWGFLTGRAALSPAPKQDGKPSIVDTSDEACAVACMLVTNPMGSFRKDGDGWQKRVNDLIRALRDERNSYRQRLFEAIDDLSYADLCASGGLPEGGGDGA